MFRVPRCAVLGFGLMLAAASTEAREMQLSIENRIGGDSNVFRRSSDRVDDGFYTISPRVVVREENAKLNYDFSYQPTYETYFETSGIDGFDHRGEGVLSWRPTSVDTIGVSGSFASVRNPIIESRGASVEASDRDRVQRSDARLSFSRALNEVLSVQAGAVFTDLDYSRNSSTDSRSYSAQLGTQYILNPNTVVGLSGSFRRREDRGGRFQFRTETDISNLGAFFQRSLTPTLNISVQAGPSFFRSRQKFPGNPDSKSRSTSYFAAATVDKTWQRSNFGASYTRSESAGGGSTSSSIVDNVTLKFDHRFSRRWSFRVQGIWLQSKEVSEATGTNKRKSTQYRAMTSVTRRITRQLSVTGQFLYFNQDQNQNQTASGSQSIGDVYTGSLSLRYTFDPFKF
jgi:hypothetical protein